MINMDKGKNSLGNLFCNFEKVSQNKGFSNILKKEKDEELSVFVTYNIQKYVSFISFSKNVLKDGGYESFYNFNLKGNTFEYMKNQTKASVEDKALLKELNNSNVAEYFTQKKDMLIDFIDSQRDSVEFYNIVLNAGIINYKNKLFFMTSTIKDLSSIRYNLRFETKNKDSLFNEIVFYDLKKKELEYVLSNYNISSQGDFFLRVKQAGIYGIVDDSLSLNSTVLNKAKNEMLNFVETTEKNAKNLGLKI